ncbi:uncharacterized protein [Porites lutea]|uniref:uncharacterized protein n=1 Tax=Porites lutea TaxID=51062 RepID=UPI003CC5DE6A
MATAAPSPLASSREKTNGNKLSRLLIDGGTTVLRNIFDHYHPPANLTSDLNSNYSILNNLLRRRVLNGHQWDKLFPSGGGLPDSNTFDITLLFLLLTNICGLSPPLTGWHTKPPPADNSLEANLARVKFFRNVLYGHVTSTGVDATSFSSFWHEISIALHSLGLDQAEIDRLKAEQGGEEDYLDALIEWADSEENIKAQLKDIQKFQTKTEESIAQVLQTQLNFSETQCKTQDVAEEVLRMELKGQKILLDSKSKLDEVSQLINATHQARNEANQESILLLEKVCESQSKTIQAVDVMHESIQEVKQEVKSLTKRKNEHAGEVLKTLVKSEFKGDIEFHANKFQEGTREWIFKSIEDWLDDQASPHRVMVISGNPGMGKTVISAVVSQRMQKAGRLAGSHFCQHNNSRYRDPRLMLQSLAGHLCQAMPSYKDTLEEQLSRNLGKDLNNMGVEELFALLFKEPLSTVQDPGRNILIVIDGLDESEYQGRNELLHVISNHFSMLPVWIRILITTRPERNITEALRHLKPIELEQKQEENLNDIQTLFENQLSNKIGEEHKDVLLKELVKKSEGLFIYAYFIVDFIQKNVSILTPDQLESVLPSGISSVYLSYFKRLENELCKELHADEEHFLRFLCALTASREPLPVEFIAKILYPGEKSLTAQRKVNKAICCISTLLPVREGRLHFFHKSIKDWIIASSPYEQHDFTVDEKEGHDVLSDLCASELDSIKRKGVHGRQFTNTESYALIHTVQHMLEANDDHKWIDGSETMTGTSNQVYQYVTDLELIYVKLCVNRTSATEDLFRICNEHSGLLNEQRLSIATLLYKVLRKHYYMLLDHPHLFFQCLINDGVPVLSSEAASIVESSLPTIPYMKNLDNSKEQTREADEARFYCSDNIACFDVSPKMDYLVCECRDGTIHLFSLQTGTKVWVRPSPIKREYGFRNEDHVNGAYHQIEMHFLSFYNSVIFHPNGKSIIPGTLQYVYTLTGEKEDLFPESDCTFSNCALRSLKDGDSLFTHCPAEPKGISIWDMENGQKLFIDCEKYIFSFTVSDDGSLIAFSNLDVDHSGTITVFDSKRPSRLYVILPDCLGYFVCGLLRFTSDNNTLACGFLHKKCPDDDSCPYCDFTFCYDTTGKPELIFLRPLNAYNSHFEKVERRAFVLWPCGHSGTSEKTDFLEQDHSFFWGKKIQRRIPNLCTGSSILLNDETVLVGSPDHNYVMMLNVGVLKSEPDFTDTKRIIDLHKREIAFSLEGDAIYFIISQKYIAFPPSPSSITVWGMSTREILTSKTFSGPTSIAPMKTGVVLVTTEKPRIVAELWNFDLSECKQRIVELTSKTAMLCRVNMFPVSDNRIAFFYHPRSYELKCIRSLQNREENEESSKADLLEGSDGNFDCVDFIDVTNFGGKLISSLRIKAGDVNESLDGISCSSSLSQVLVCSSRVIMIGNHGLVDKENVTLSLRNEGITRWERHTTFSADSMHLFNPDMIFSPKNDCVVTWNTLDGGQGIHVLKAETGETLHVFLRDQKDIVKCKFLDDESLICCSEDNFLRLYSIRTGDLLSILDIGERPLCLGACLYQPLVAIGLSETRIKFVHVQLPTEYKKKK